MAPTDMNALIRRALGKLAAPDVDQTLTKLAALLDDDAISGQLSPAARNALSGYAAERARETAAQAK